MLSIILAGVLLTGGCGQPGTNELPQEVLVPLDVVQNDLPEIEAVQGFAALPLPVDVGDRAFAGTVSQGDDTHIGYGSLAGEYVIGVTSAGYPATTENTAKLIDLTREAVERAETA